MPPSSGPRSSHRAPLEPWSAAAHGTSHLSARLLWDRHGATADRPLDAGFPASTSWLYATMSKLALKREFPFPLLIELLTDCLTASLHPLIPLRPEDRSLQPVSPSSSPMSSSSKPPSVCRAGLGRATKTRGVKGTAPTQASQARPSARPSGSTRTPTSTVRSEAQLTVWETPRGLVASATSA